MPQSTAITLCFYGPFRVIGSDGADIAALSRRAQAMLAFLSHQPGMRAERATLADLLWSDRPEDQARASLRQELSALRRRLPDGVLIATRQIISLDTGSVEIAATNEGEFMHGFDLASEGFEDWLRTSRMADEASKQAPEPEQTPTPRNSLRPSLAVLPFEELGAAESDMFADGVVEEITSALSRVRDFHIIARQSAQTFKGSELDIPTIAQRLGVEYIVQGSIRRAGERLRLTVQLIQAKNARTVWSECLDDHIDDLFDVQDRIAARVAGHLSPNLRTAEIKRADTRAPEDRNAYELMLTAMPFFWQHGSMENRKAIDLLNASLEKAPNCAPAIALLAQCNAHECCYLWSSDPNSNRKIAADLIDRALPLSQDHAPSLVALAAASALAIKDNTLALDLTERALSIDPNNAWGWLRLGWIKTYLGKSQEALDHFDRAQDLSPLDPFLFNIDFGRAATLRTYKRYDEAIALIEKGLRAAPKAHWAYRMLFGTHWMNGDRDKAIKAGQKWLASHPHLDRATLIAGLPEWPHDPVYVDLLNRFDELIPPE